MPVALRQTNGSGDEDKWNMLNLVKSGCGGD